MTDYEKLIIEKYKKGEVRKFSPILNMFKQEIRTMLNIGCTSSIIMEYIESKTGLELVLTTFAVQLSKFKKANEIYFEKKEISEKPEQSPIELKNETKNNDVIIKKASTNKQGEPSLEELYKKYGVDDDSLNADKLKKKEEDDKLKAMFKK